MDVSLTLLSTVIVVVVGAVIGVVTANVLRDGPLRTIWALVVSLVFVVSAMAAVVLDHSWMFGNAQRALAEAVAIGAAVTGIVFAMRAPN